MKTVVITGSARGLGFNMAKFFREKDFNVVISDLSKDNLVKAKEELETINSKGSVRYRVCNVSNNNDLIELMNFSF